MTFSAFLRDETGAASVDWVVLSSACVVLGVLVSDGTSAGVEHLAQTVATDLEGDDPTRNYFDDISSMIDLSGFVAFSDDYGVNWGINGFDEEGLNWAQAAYAGYDAFDDDVLIAHYMGDYNIAVNGDPTTDAYAARSVDHLTVLEEVLLNRGYPVPSSYMTAAEVRALYQ